MKDAGKCWKCKCQIYLPDELHDAARRSPKISIFCGYGHEGVFRDGETEEDKLRRERDRLKQDAARLQDDVAYEQRRAEAAERRASAARGVATRLKNRAAVGLCPCCNRTVSQLANHMKTKHPDFATAEIIPMVAAS